MRRLGHHPPCNPAAYKLKTSSCRCLCSLCLGGPWTAASPPMPPSQAQTSWHVRSARWKISAAVTRAWSTSQHHTGVRKRARSQGTCMLTASCAVAAPAFGRSKKIPGSTQRSCAVRTACMRIGWHSGAGRPRTRSACRRRRSGPVRKSERSAADDDDTWAQSPGPPSVQASPALSVCWKPAHCRAWIHAAPVVRCRHLRNPPRTTPAQRYRCCPTPCLAKRCPVAATEAPAPPQR